MVQMKLRKRVEIYMVDMIQTKLERAIKIKPQRPFNSKPLRLPGGQDNGPLRTAHTQTRPRADLEKIATEGSMDEIIETLENGHLEQAGGYREAAIVGLPEDIQSNLAERLYRKRTMQRALIKAVSYAVPIALISTLALAGVNSGAIGLAVVFSVIFRYVAPRLMKDIGIKPGQIAGLLESDNKLAEEARGILAKLFKEESPAWSPGSKANTRSNISMRSTSTPRFPTFPGHTLPSPPSEIRFAAPDEIDREQQAEAECLEADTQQTKRTR